MQDEIPYAASQRLTDLVPVISLIPNHRGSRRQLLQHHISASEVTACPSLRCSCRRPPLLSQNPWSLLVMPPLAPESRGDQTPLVEAGCRGMGFEIGVVKHQHIWLCGIGC